MCLCDAAMRRSQSAIEALEAQPQACVGFMGEGARRVQATGRVSCMVCGEFNVSCRVSFHESAMTNVTMTVKKFLSLRAHRPPLAQLASAGALSIAFVRQRRDAPCTLRGSGVSAVSDERCIELSSRAIAPALSLVGTLASLESFSSGNG